MIREDFAAAGGVSEGLRLNGVDPATVRAVEWEADACATARAAGHHREHMDVRKARGLDWRHLVGYTGGPPCQSFAQSGKGAGLQHIRHLQQAAALVAVGKLPEEAIGAVQDEALDERSVLSLEPLHVVVAHRPQWVMLEQVPGVLPLWEACAEQMSAMGYHVATGLVHSEQFGVGQARTRAILMAHQDRPVALPEPTHSRYYSRNPGLLDLGVDPWVTLAEALEWDEETLRDRASRVPNPDVALARRWVWNRPSPTVVGSYRPDVIAAPGYRKAGDPPRQNTPGSVWVTVQEAGVLQSFRRDYPWQGSESSQYRQVGNAHPPRMAAAILRCLL